jgi:hypothetical protein
MATHQITDLRGIPYDFSRPQMGTSYVDDISNRSGVNDPRVARTQYPTSGHRPVPLHVQAARRRQVLIDGMSGARVYEDVEDRLRNDAADAEARKVQSHATAVNQAIMHSPTHGGRLGGGTVLARPADHLPWLFFGAGE